MAIESRIARRYLWAARKQAHTAFLSFISMLGLAVGVATLLVSIALLSGLQGQITGRLIESSPQILVEPSGQNSIDDADAVIAAARKLGMTDIRPHVSGIAWGANEDQSAGRPMRARSIVPGRDPDATFALTRGFAASLGLDVGDWITVVAPRMRLTPFGPIPVMKRYRIDRLVVAGDEDDATDAWLSHDEAANLFGTGGRPTGIEMYGPPERAEEIQSALMAQFPRLQFKTWKEINRPLFLALRLEKIVMFATISLIIFVAALNLVSSLSMLILEKRPSVGVLRTLGATEKNIRSLFMQLGLLIGLTGTILGNILGIGVSWAANHWQLVSLPPQVYFISYLPFRLDVEDIVVVNVVAIVLSIVATWYPARIASRIDPITAIKEE
ncbi:MAG TPA: FtsX-like permease family protein [Thermoanaerobaculia bacterium]|jgi:lipoprotein-releasing system permease protein|nr:FtsX-like permease family protein [Thermoanaerobaculia bacterium]